MASWIALATGFIWDNLTLTRVDLLFDNLILLSYLSVAAIAIATLTLIDAGRLRAAFLLRYRVWLPVVMQFAFGGLFSGFVVFYSRSGSLYASWPFLLGLALLLVGNEFFRARYERLTFRISVLYLALFSFLIFYVPVVAHRMGELVFLASGAASLLIIALYLRGLEQLASGFVSRSKRPLAYAVGGIFFLINMLYFTNAIPPIPLSLKEIGIYHSVEKKPEGGYRVTFEDGPWYAFWRHSDNVFHRTAGEPLFCFSAVFAPTDLTTQIFHRWGMYDERSGRWIDTGRISFGISGGRDGGYRGYSIKSNVSPGLWRCSVETGRWQLLGRTEVRVEAATTPPELQTEER